MTKQRIVVIIHFESNETASIVPSILLSLHQIFMNSVFIAFALLFFVCTSVFCQAQPSKTAETDWELYSPGAFPQGWILPIDKIVAAYGQTKCLYLVGDFKVTAAGQSRCILRNNDFPTFRFVVDFPKSVLPPKENTLITRTSQEPLLVSSIKTGTDGQTTVYLHEIIKDGVLHATRIPPGTEIKDPYEGRPSIVQPAGIGNRKPDSLARALAPAFLSLPDSKIILSVPKRWTVKDQRDKDGDVGMYSPDQPAKGLPSRIHLARYSEADRTLQSAIDSEIDRITARGPSGNDRRSYKGSTPIKTDSGMQGKRADFYNDEPQGRFYSIVKYYFFDENGKIFRICAHVYGDESRFKDYDQAIIEGLKFNEAKQ